MNTVTYLEFCHRSSTSRLPNDVTSGPPLTSSPQVQTTLSLLEVDLRHGRATGISKTVKV